MSQGTRLGPKLTLGRVIFPLLPDNIPYVRAFYIELLLYLIPELIEELCPGFGVGPARALVFFVGVQERSHGRGGLRTGFPVRWVAHCVVLDRC